MAGKYVTNGELSTNAILTPDLLSKSTIELGSIIPIKTGVGRGAQGDVQVGANARQYHNRYVTIKYPGSAGGNNFILQDVAVMSRLTDYYSKTSVMFGVPKWVATQLAPKITAAGQYPTFEDKRMVSDETYWWTKVSFVEATEGQEYIRVYEDESIDVYGSFADFFAEYPSSVLANVTCSLKLLCDTPMGTEPTGKEVWRCSLGVSMVTPTNVCNVAPPRTETKQRSAVGAADKMKPGLAALRAGPK